MFVPLLKQGVCSSEREERTPVMRYENYATIMCNLLLSNP